MSAMATEVELKLRFPPARLRELLAAPALATPRGSRTRILAATYYDTPALDLWRRRIALRIRREGGQWVQTVKGEGMVRAGTHRRLEIETVLKSGRPDVSVLPRHAATRFLRSPGVAAVLIPVMRTDISRKLLLIEPAPGVLVEAAVDSGTISAGRRHEQVCELELELKSGPVSALYDIARQVSARVPLALEHRSKAERGYELYGAKMNAPLKAAPVSLAGGMTAGAAFQAIAAEALHQIHANEYGVAVSADPEYLHQMRVGIRRLRSALALFAPLLDAAADAQSSMLRELGARLGPARDWDVFIAETLPAVCARWPDEELPDAFRRACLGHQARAREKVKKSIKTNTYDKSMIGLAVWISDQFQASGPPRRSLRGFAARVLGERHARVLKRGRHLERLTAAELHRLRIAVKQMRYAVEFFAGLFPARRMSGLRARLSMLQDILGCMNDASVVSKLMAEVTAQSRSRTVAVAAGRVAGWYAALAEHRREALKPAWRRFCAQRATWRA